MIFFGATAPMSGCKKTTIHDTTIKTVHDTTIKTVHDTTTVKDSTWELTSALAAYYNFNGGTLNDSSGNSNHITFTTNVSPTTDRLGRAGNAYLFNGSSSYMKVPNSPSLNTDEMTIYAIIKINGFWHASCAANEVLGKGSPDNVGGFYTLRYTDGNTCDGITDEAHEYFGIGHGDNDPEGSTSYVISDTVILQKNVWYKVAYTFDGDTSKIYINGLLKGVRVKSTFFTANTNDLFIGRHEDPAFPYWFNGVIDEIRIYRRALSQRGITQLNNLTK